MVPFHDNGCYNIITPVCLCQFSFVCVGTDVLKEHTRVKLFNFMHCLCWTHDKDFENEFKDPKASKYQIAQKEKEKEVC